MGWVLVDVYATRLCGLDVLGCCFKLVAAMVEGDIQKFVDYANRPAFLKRKLVVFGMVCIIQKIWTPPLTMSSANFKQHTNFSSNPENPNPRSRSLSSI